METRYYEACGRDRPICIRRISLEEFHSTTGETGPKKGSQLAVIPLLKFSNTYRATASLSRLFSDPELQASCMAFISKDGTEPEEKMPSLFEVRQMLFALHQGNSVRAVCDRYSKGDGQDVRRLVAFAQKHGLIKCHKRYPVQLRSTARPHGFSSRGETAQGARCPSAGLLCPDRVCSEARIEQPCLDQIIEEEPHAALVRR